MGAHKACRVQVVWQIEGVWLYSAGMGGLNKNNIMAFGEHLWRQSDKIS